jgi:hypothetical protein
MKIPEGYARVMVDRVKNGWEDLGLEIPGGDEEGELGQALHTWICWNKQYIRLPQETIESAEWDPNPASRSPAAQGYPSMEPPSQAAARDPSFSPSPSTAASRDPSICPPPPPPPPTPAKKKKSDWIPPPPPPRLKKTQQCKKKE